MINFCSAWLWLYYLVGVEAVGLLKFWGLASGSTIGTCRRAATGEKQLPRHEKRVTALRESVEKAKDKALAYDEQLVRNFIEEIKVFPDKITITVKGGIKEDIAI